MSSSAKHDRLAVSRPIEGAAGQTGRGGFLSQWSTRKNATAAAFVRCIALTVRSTMISWSTSGSARAVASALTNARKKPSPW